MLNLLLGWHVAHLQNLTSSPYPVCVGGDNGVAGEGWGVIDNNGVTARKLFKAVSIGGSIQ